MVMVKRCPKCGRDVTIEPGVRPVCVGCGFSAPAQAPRAPPQPRAGPTNEASAAEGVGPFIGRGVALFSVLGFAMGLAMMLVLTALGFFEEGGDLGGAFAGAIFLLVAVVVVYLGGILVAVVLTAGAARRLPSRGVAAAAGGIVGAVGHLLLVLFFLTTITVGMLIMVPTESGGAEEEATPTDLSAFGDFALGLVPAAVAGAAAGAIVWTPSGTGRAAPGAAHGKASTSAR